MLHAEIIRPEDVSLADRQRWSELQRETPAFGSPLLGPDFAAAVGAVRKDAAVAVYRRAGQTIGFLAHHRRPDGLARPIGATWSDYHALIASPDAAIEGAEALRAAGIKAWRFAGLLDPHGAFAASQAASKETYLIKLDGPAEAYLEALRAASPKRFKNLRRLENKLDREVGELRLVAPDHDDLAFEMLLGWKREQFRRTGLHDVLHPSWTQDLLRSLFQTREGPLQGLLITLRVRGRPVGAHFGVRLGGAYHPWLAAYDPEFGAYSPGMVLISRAIEAMPALGLVSYDLSDGSDHYKRPFASEGHVVREGSLRPNGVGASRLSGLLEARAPTLHRVQRRLDHIATCELSLSGRLQGIAAAVAGGSRRLAAAGPGAEHH